MMPNAKPTIVTTSLLLVLLTVSATAVAQITSARKPTPTPTSQQKVGDLALALEGVPGCAGCIPPLFSLQQGQKANVDLTAVDKNLSGRGWATVERSGNETKINLKLEGLKTGGGSYYLYALDRQGKTYQLGEVKLDNGNGKLDTTTSLDTFSLFLSRDQGIGKNSPVLMRGTLPSGFKEVKMQLPKR